MDIIVWSPYGDLGDLVDIWVTLSTSGLPYGRPDHLICKHSGHLTDISSPYGHMGDLVDILVALWTSRSLYGHPGRFINRSNSLQTRTGRK